MSTDRSKVKILTVKEESSGQRLDNFLLRELKGVPRSLIYRIVRRGEVRINMGRAAVSRRLKCGDQIRVPPLRTGSASPAGEVSASMARGLEGILFEDERILVLNKPAGMAVHGGSGIPLGLIEALRQLRPDAPYLELVHRLDRETSGCLLIAKRASALRALHEDLRQTAGKRISKHYLALVSGAWTDRRVVCAPLKKYESRAGERLVTVSEANGRYARSVFSPRQSYSRASLVEIELVTGRTHQARVHAAHAGHPIIGDAKYGDPGANAEYRALGVRRLFLHAHRVRFIHPGSNRQMVVESPLPMDLEQALARLSRSPAAGLAVSD